jgi:hypothetical protein
VLADFDEVALLSPEAHEELVAGLVEAIRYARCRQVPSEAAVSRAVEKAYKAKIQGQPYPTVRAPQMPLGVSVGKVGVSNRAVAQQIFISDVGRVLEGAGLPTARWRKRYDRGDGPDPDAPESFFFRLCRDLADAFHMPLPQDLKLPSKRAAQHVYGAMSPAMKAAQDAELALERQGTAKATAGGQSAVQESAPKAQGRSPRTPQHRRKSAAR